MREREVKAEMAATNMMTVPQDVIVVSDAPNGVTGFDAQSTTSSKAVHDLASNHVFRLYISYSRRS